MGFGYPRVLPNFNFKFGPTMLKFLFILQLQKNRPHAPSFASGKRALSSPFEVKPKLPESAEAKRAKPRSRSRAPRRKTLTGTYSHTHTHTHSHIQEQEAHTPEQ